MMIPKLPVKPAVIEDESTAEQRTAESLEDMSGPHRVIAAADYIIMSKLDCR